jgi:hypothetical protein
MSTSKTCVAKARLLFFIATFLTIAGGVHPAPAQQAGGPPSLPPVDLQALEILPTPYLWLPWTSVGAHPHNAGLPSTSTTIDPGTLFSHLTWVPFMGQVEFRSGQFGLLTDYVHAPLKSGVGTSGVLFTGGQSGLTLDTGTAMFMYRAIVQPSQYLDVGLGVRAWGVDGDISLNRRFLPPVSLTRGGSWADPLIAIRYHRELGNGFSATAYGDVGGFGAGADVDWQLVGTIDYAWKPGIDLHAGFRSLNFDIGAPRADFNLHMYGPIVAATFRF